MAYQQMDQKQSGDAVTAADWNRIRQNFDAGIPDVFTTVGQLAYASAVNVVSVLDPDYSASPMLLTAEAAGPVWNAVPRMFIENGVSALTIDPQEAWIPWQSFSNAFFVTETLDAGNHYTPPSTDNPSTDAVGVTINWTGFYLVGYQTSLQAPTSGTTRNTTQPWYFRCGVFKNGVIEAMLGAKTLSTNNINAVVNVTGNTILRLSRGDRISMVQMVRSYYLAAGYAPGYFYVHRLP